MRVELAMSAVAFLLLGCTPQWQADAVERVRAKLKDPNAAKFDRVRQCDAPDMVYGRVNAKNGFGAYDGAKLFVVQNGSVYFVNSFADLAEADEPEESFFVRLQAYCYGQGPKITAMSYMKEIQAKLDARRQ